MDPLLLSDEEEDIPSGPFTEDEIDVLLADDNELGDEDDAVVITVNDDDTHFDEGESRGQKMTIFLKFVRKFMLFPWISPRRSFRRDIS